MWARGTCGERAGYDSAEPSMPPSVAAAPPQRPFGGGSSFPSVAAALLFWQNPAKGHYFSQPTWGGVPDLRVTPRF